MTKICIVCSKFFPIVGGGETHSLQVATLLSKRGFKVTVITNENDEAISLDKNLPFDIKRIKGFNDEKININVAVPELYKALIGADPDIIHIHNYEPYLVFSLFADSFKTKKVFLTIHNTPLFPRRVFGSFNNFEAEFAVAKNLIDNGIHRYITVASKYYKNSIEEIATTPQQVEIIPYGVDLKHFNADLKSSFRDTLGILQSDILIVCPSRIIVRKGIKEAIESLSYLPKNFKLFLPTSFEPKDIEYFNEIKTSVGKLALKERVIFADRPYLANEMPLIYKASDIVIMPSYYEGFGLAVLEAMAMKKPVIGSNVVGLDEAINNGEDGLLVRVKNSKELGDAILRLTADNKLKERLVENAYRKVSLEFEINKQIDKLIRLYNE
jgi:glycosyltransferase involved in cell wall biosynthesis